MDPLEFWSEKKHADPNLFAVAVKYFTPLPASVESERLFSSAGLIVSPLRNRLKAKHVEILAFLHFNLPKLNNLY